MRLPEHKPAPVSRHLTCEIMLAIVLSCLVFTNTNAQQTPSPNAQRAADLMPLLDLLIDADDTNKPPSPPPPPPLPPGTHPDIVKIIEVVGRNPGGVGWMDSYSVGTRCYCDTNFDHGIGTVQVDTPVGTRTVLQVCTAIGPGPGRSGRPIYNDIQCGNGPPNTAGDETDCPGRVDIGPDGCGHIGPKWDLSVLE